MDNNDGLVSLDLFVYKRDANKSNKVYSVGLQPLKTEINNQPFDFNLFARFSSLIRK